MRRGGQGRGAAEGTIIQPNERAARVVRAKRMVDDGVIKANDPVEALKQALATAAAPEPERARL